MFEGKLSCQYIGGVRCFAIQDPPVIKSVILQTLAQLRALVGLLTHRCCSSIYGLSMIWELVLNAALGMKCML